MTDTQTARPVRFLPEAVLQLHQQARGEQVYDAAWRAREAARCAHPSIAGLKYLVAQYGSIEPPVGDPVPFNLWPVQEAVLHEMWEHPLSWWLKARRLGLSWLALHYAYWVARFAPLGFGARVVLVNKTDADAAKMLGRIRRLNDRMPGWIRGTPARGADNVHTLGFADTGAEIVSLPASEAAARMETVTLFVLDEFAFPVNGRAAGIWASILPTIEGGGRGIGISTGNGRAGDGGTFAAVFEAGAVNSLGHDGIYRGFLPWWARPGRTPSWYARERARYPDKERFTAEYPATVDEALAGSARPMVYSAEGVAAAVELGALLDEHRRGLILDGAELGIDWGDFQTFGLWGVQPMVGSMWVVDEKVLMRTAPERAGTQLLAHHPAGLSAGLAYIASDSAPAGTNRTFGDLVADAHAHEPDAFPPGHQPVQFSRFKEGGGDRYGVNTVAYVANLVENSADLWQRLQGCTAAEQIRVLEGAHDILAISPRCRVLVHQLRELRRDPETVKVMKPPLSPSDPLAGDHGPDALVALLARRASAHEAHLQADAA